MSEPGFQSSAIIAADAGATSVAPVPAQDGGAPTTPAIDAASTPTPLGPAISQTALTSAQPGAWTELADTTALDAATATPSPQWAAPSSSTAYTAWQTPSTAAPTTYSTPETASSSIPASSIPASLTSASAASASAASASSASASSTSATAAAATATATSTTTPSSAASTSTKWLPGVIVGSIAFAAILAGLAFWLIRRRRRRQKYHAADQCDQGGAPLASPDMFGYRRPLMGIGMSQTDAERAEQERRELIRKSMISRSSWSASQFDYQADHQYGNQSQVDITAAGAYTANNESVGLRDDYKEWDAQMQQQKALLAAQHPSQAEVSHVELPASRAVSRDVSREVSRERLRLDTRNISPSPASPQQVEAFPVSPVSAMSVLPPVPTRSHKRPPSTDFADAIQPTQTVTQHSNTADSSAGVLSRRPTNQSTRSKLSARSITRNPHTRHLTENENTPESPSSLYSVDLQDGRQNRAWAQYHHADAV